jgi:hypothetical protein
LSALDTTKEILRITSTAGLSKDVIDLLQAKVSLLNEQIVLLEKEKAILVNEKTLLADKAARFETENIHLRQQLQDSQPVGFVENQGVLWKRTPTGFEAIPYCKECKSHPIMTPLHQGGIWVCANGEHTAPLAVEPPA